MSAEDTVRFVVCDNNGRIKRTGQFPRFARVWHEDTQETVSTRLDPRIMAVAADNEYVFEATGAGEDTHYVDLVRGTVEPKAFCPTILRGMSLLDVPVTAIVTINRTAYPTSESTVDLGFDQPGTYKIKVESLRYQTKFFEVTV